ncbi:efflux RND transporter periplasmic adaptor subunit [Actinoplanes sp. TBRC 11911]|uniref:efflux RND transporter periplasmic adaptor subunit n=1 Tax=Actinoplanes sp. TBRC 11911 TaxID=2729386 RepID=UPI00145DC425|nr:efflux RND transporter periplasmic adaptor subunit [Actinoplanes sp. TBRC 11911]NMO51857.1 efflux RND transporter periplasmic adaptor subunit [Actinoplanes sp. TBRC 11911]
MARLLPSFLVNLLLAALALGAAGWATVQVRADGAVTSAAASGARTVTVGRGIVTATVSADGSLEPVTSAIANFGTGGTVTAVSVKVGDKVTKGQLLAQVDAAAAQRALDLAKANRTAAQDAVNRATGAGTDAARNELATAQIAVDAAQAGVDGTTLTAPMTGTVTSLNGTVGSSVNTNAASPGFVEIADLTRLQVVAAFAEADATRVKAGQTAAITWSALHGATANGEVLAVDPSATTSNSVVSYGVTTSIGSLPPGARAGQSVTVSVTTGTARNALMVNAAAVAVSGSRYTVGVLGAGGTTETRAVRVGVKGDSAYEITSGLAEGEQVVVPQGGGPP